VWPPCARRAKRVCVAAREGRLAASHLEGLELFMQAGPPPFSRAHMVPQARAEGNDAGTGHGTRRGSGLGSPRAEGVTQLELRGSDVGTGLGPVDTAHQA